MPAPSTPSLSIITNICSYDAFSVLFSKQQKKITPDSISLLRSVYTDDCLGPGNLKMVHLAKQVGGEVACCCCCCICLYTFTV